MDSTFYIISDHQGSYNPVALENGSIKERLSFDAWGRRRNADTWTQENPPTNFTFARGYTGHEHLANFGIINMNGRIYDPVMARVMRIVRLVK